MVAIALSQSEARWSFLGGFASAAANRCDCGGAQYGSPTTGPARTSRNIAMSRTERARGPLVANPAHASPETGAKVRRPRDGLRPTTPQQLAGMRIEPPPSLPSAIAPIPAAIAAAAPPLDPPAVCAGFHG